MNRTTKIFWTWATCMCLSEAGCSSEDGASCETDSAADSGSLSTVDDDSESGSAVDTVSRSSETQSDEDTILETETETEQDTNSDVQTVTDPQIASDSDTSLPPDSDFASETDLTSDINSFSDSDTEPLLETDSGCLSCTDSSVESDTVTASETEESGDGGADSDTEPNECVDLTETEENLGRFYGTNAQFEIDRNQKTFGLASVHATVEYGYMWAFTYNMGPETFFDLSPFDKLTFSIQGTAPDGWQGNYPSVRLVDIRGVERYYVPTTLLMSEEWLNVELPFSGDLPEGWTVRGAADLTHLSRVEIQTDVFAAGPYDVRIDGLRVLTSDGTCPNTRIDCGVGGTFAFVDGIPSCTCKGDLLAAPDGVCRKGTANVLVVNLDPQIETRDDKPLHWVGRWNDPTILGAHVRRRIQSASSGKVLYHVVEYLEVDGYPRFRDGYEYNDEDYLAAWVDQTAPPHEGSASYADLFEELDLSAKIAANDVSEVWIWSPPGTGLDEYAEKFPGDLCYYQTDNPWFYRPYDIPEQNRTVFVMGWNYERGEGEALESYTHRIEGTLSLVVGKGIWDPLNHRDNPWNRFTIFDALLPGEAEVGNVHYPPNGIADYDYANETFVPSRADDWFNYPNFTGAVSQINRDSWSGISADSESIDYHTGYLAWWMNHLPRNDSELDGFHNNWWRYIADYDNAVESLPPPDGNLRHCETGMYAK